MRRTVAAFAFLVISVSGLPALASHNGHDHSPNIRQIDAKAMSWPVDDRHLEEFAFQGRLVVGSMQGGETPLAHQESELPEGGLGIFRIKDNGDLRQLGRFRCKSTSELSIWGDLVLQGSIQSQAAWAGEPVSRCDRSGLRIIDISDPSRPRELAFLRIPCGVGGHALMPSGRKLYLYAPSSCQEQTETPPGAGVYNEMTVIGIPLDHPARAKVASIVDIQPMVGCQWIVVIRARDLGACSADNRFMLIDVSDPAFPQMIGAVQSVSHPIQSISFSWDGSLLALGATRVESSGGPSVTLFDVEDTTNPSEVGSWSVPEGPGFDHIVQSLSFVPMKEGRDVLVAGHGARGTWIVDVTDSNTVREIAHYTAMDTSAAYPPPDPPPSYTYSSYWYNGYFYAADRYRVRVFRVDGFDRDTVHYFRARYNPQTVIGNFR